GSAQAAKKANRIAAEGSSYIAIDENTAVILEVNCETDFVTKNDQFKKLLEDLGKHILENKPADTEEIAGQKLLGKDETVEEHLNSVIATIGEKISLRRFVTITKTANDFFGAYTHMDGQIGVLTLVEGTN